MHSKVKIETQEKIEAINITSHLTQAALLVKNGTLLVSIPHTTAALIVCEDDDELRADLVSTAKGWLSQLEPFSHRKNNNPNAAAHILSAFGGFQVVLPVVDGQIQMGTYQNLLLLEMDGPKHREVWINRIS